MGRPPCSEKVGVKKGPWTPEEDIMLVSYVQEHGPGNWRSVPANTGLKRCSKSCRLRWTNYLRPGIKRGTFTDHEEKMIIQLQALLGNKWAAIASYLPERTDNDIKNYWNTHLKKKLDRLHQSGPGHRAGTNPISRGQWPQWERRLQTDIHTAKQALKNALSIDDDGDPNPSLAPQQIEIPHPAQTTSYSYSYASSTENIARLLKDWAKNPKPAKCETDQSNQNHSSSSCSTDEIVAAAGILGNKAEAAMFGGRRGFEGFEYSSMSDDFSRSMSPKPDPDGMLFDLENWPLLDDQGILGMFCD